MNRECRLTSLMLVVFVPALSLGADLEPRRLMGHRGSVMAVAFSLDGKLLASSKPGQDHHIMGRPVSPLVHNLRLSING